MIGSRSILARFSPDGSFSQEYLRRHEALLTEGEWEWQGQRALAYIFDSHAAAETFAAEHRYQSRDGHTHTPWALVLGGDEAGAPSPRHAAQEARAAEVEQRARFGLVTPSEAFETLEKRHLA